MIWQIKLCKENFKIVKNGCWTIGKLHNLRNKVIWKAKIHEELLDYKCRSKFGHLIFVITKPFVERFVFLRKRSYLLLRQFGLFGFLDGHLSLLLHEILSG